VLPADRFYRVIEDASLISVDFIVLDSQNRLLLGKRVNPPAQDHWFVPGGRIYKGELLADAMQRLLISELGSKAAQLRPEWMGLYEHHYPGSVAGELISTHYVVLAHRVIWPTHFNFSLPKAQHAEYRWQSLQSIVTAKDVHEHSRWYAQDLLGVSRCPRSYP